MAFLRPPGSVHCGGGREVRWVPVVPPQVGCRRLAMPIKRLPWLRMLKKTDPEPPVRLPIAAGPLSNGEGWWPDTARKRLIRKLVLEKAEIGARMHGVDRREFLASSCGMATTLFVIN